MRVYVHKAEAIRSDTQVPDLFIASDSIMMPSKSPENDRKLYASEARAIATALRRSLPGGTYDRLIVELLETRVSDLSVQKDAFVKAEGE